MRSFPKQIVTASLLVLMAIVLPACGDSPTSPPPPPPTPPTEEPAPEAPVAVIVVEVPIAVASDSPAEGFLVRITVPTRMREFVGVGATIDFIRMTFLDAIADDIVDVVTLEGAVLTDQIGSDRLEAFGTREFTVFFDTNALLSTRARLTYGFIDDKGNELFAEFIVDF